jgi:hypothetical protein
MKEENQLHLVLPLRVPFNQVLIAGDHFLRLSQSVTGEVLPERGNDVIWVFDNFNEGSLDLIVRPEPVTSELALAMPRVVHAIASGIRMVEREAKRPDYFNDVALLHLKNLARLEGVRVNTGKVGAPITAAARNNVDRIIGEEQEEWGSLEGRIESLTVHRERSFNLYDPINEERIECSFGYRIPTETVGLAVEKRVAVYGRIVYRGGKIVRMRAEEIEVFPAADQLPTAEEVFGILSDGVHGS